MNILHLVFDEKFIDFFSRKIKSASNDKHRFIVHVDDPTRELSLIKEADVYKKVNDLYFASKAVDTDLAWCDVLVVHFLTVHGARMILKAASHVKIVWSGWGADYYYLLAGGQRALYAAGTRDIVDSIDRERKFADPLFMARLLLGPFRRIHRSRRLIVSAIKRVDFFSAPLPVDYDLLIKDIGSYFSAKYVQLNYGDFKSMFAESLEKTPKRNILVGNSSSPANNHLEVFDFLKGINLEGRKVIVPLSYGDNVYRDHVIKHGRRLLGEYFHPIMNFMPLDEYQHLIGSCLVVAMNQFRQQALGNICSALLGGAKLYLNRRSVTFKFLEERGAILFPVEDSTKANIFRELSSEQKHINKRAVKSFWGEDCVIDNFRKFIHVLRE